MLELTLAMLRGGIRGFSLPRLDAYEIVVLDE